MPLIFILLSFTAIPTGIDMEVLSGRDEHVSGFDTGSVFIEQVSFASSPASDGSKVMVFVADYVLSDLSDQLNQLQADLISEGWTVTVQSGAGMSAEDLRGLFQSTQNLDGVLLIGFLPCAWYEEDYWAEEEFPCELFLMDLDGIWGDADGDGIYDSHTGDVAPEIWLGRIDAHAMDYGSELLMLSEYLEKDHLYRTGALAPPSRALAYIDDDWSYYTHCGLNYIYGASNVTVINSESQTTASGYLAQLEQGYEFVHLMAHSCPWGHTFKVPSGMSGTVIAPEIAQVNPNTAFLQLFSCSNARWVETGCLGNWYLFGTDSGLLVCGAAKTGSMLDFEYFYQPIGSGSCFGEAFRDWWEYQAQGGFSSSERAWFYGNALLGDPTLKPLSSTGSFCGTPQEASGTDGFQVSASVHSDCFPDAAWHDGITAVAWLTGENGRLDIAARFHDDAGDSWSQVYIVDADEYWDNAVSVCFDDTGEPWLAWSDFDYSTYSYRIKTAHGLPFENVSVAVPQDGYQVSPDLAFSDRMWLVWQDWESTGGRIMLKSLTGGSYSCQLSAPGEWATAPAISTGPGGYLHAVWIRSDQNGSRLMWSCGNASGFEGPYAISDQPGALRRSPDIGCIDGTLIVTWQEDGIQSSIMAAVYDGSGWSSPVQVENDSPEHLSNPRVCRSANGEPAICWQQGNSDAVPVMSVLTGGSWSAPYQPLSSSCPVWTPVQAGSRMYWAGNEGSDWNIYCQDLTGIAQPDVPAVRPVLTANPVMGSITLTLPGDATFEGAVRVFDLSGRAVLAGNASIPPGGNFSMDCSGLPTGVYSLMIDGFSEPARFTLLR